ncbi:MAG: hypothetical protein SV686_03265 [Thermodesulfobacteriota bacterium]|nr:hypothetical protein [Thermodesulfobacteriota bacterium]
MAEGLKNLNQVHSFLVSAGWRIAKSTLYSHFQQRKLAPDQQDGRYSFENVLTYAQHFLRRQATGRKPLSKKDLILQERKLKLEVEKLEEEVARARLKRQVEESQYIDRDLVVFELAARAAVLDVGLTEFFGSNAETWIEAANGDLKYLPEFLGILMEHKDDLINQYSRPLELR